MDFFFFYGFFSFFLKLCSFLHGVNGYRNSAAFAEVIVLGVVLLWFMESLKMAWCIGGVTINKLLLFLLPLLPLFPVYISSFIFLLILPSSYSSVILIYREWNKQQCLSLQRQQAQTPPSS